MKSTVALTLSVVVAFSVAGCSFMKSQRRVTATSSTTGAVSSHDVGTLLEAGIAAYNDGNIAGARSNLEAALEVTRDKPMPEMRAQAHFYLAAVAWDVGNEEKTDEHLRQCRSLQADFEPDWTFFAPGLRKRYEDLK